MLLRLLRLCVFILKECFTLMFVMLFLTLQVFVREMFYLGGLKETCLRPFVNPFYIAGGFD